MTGVIFSTNDEITGKNADPILVANSKMLLFSLVSLFSVVLLRFSNSRCIDPIYFKFPCSSVSCNNPNWRLYSPVFCASNNTSSAYCLPNILARSGYCLSFGICFTFSMKEEIAPCASLFIAAAKLWVVNPSCFSSFACSPALSCKNDEDIPFTACAASSGALPIERNVDPSAADCFSVRPSILVSEPTRVMTFTISFAFELALSDRWLITSPNCAISVIGLPSTLAMVAIASPASPAAISNATPIVAASLAYPSRFSRATPD